MVSVNLDCEALRSLEGQVKCVRTTGLLALLLLLNSCDSGPDPGAVLAKSRDAMGQLQSFRFTAEIVQKSEDGLLEGRQSGDWAAPDQWHMKLEALGEFTGHGSETLVSGERLFTRDSESMGRAWREMTSFPPVRTIHKLEPEIFLGVPDLQKVRLLDEETLRGVAVFHITGETLQTRALPPRFPARPKGDEVEFVTKYAWLITKDDYRLLRYITEQDMGPDNHRTTMDFYDFNQPVTIEVPEIGAK